LIKAMPGLDVRYRTHAEGSLYRVDGPVLFRLPQRAVTADLDGQVRLLGADVGDVSPSGVGPVAGAPPSPGTFTVTLYWQGTGSARRDYHVFVHLIDGQGNTVTQSDHRPGGDLYPPSLWADGEVLRDEHQMAVPPPGSYELQVGMYWQNARLRMTGGGDSVSLGKVGF
jgi:hypothetical protein